VSTDPAILLGLPVCHRELRLGTVSDVLLARWGESAVAMVVSSAWGGTSYVLPIGAATIHADRIDTSPFGLLSNGEAEYYRQRGRTLLNERETRRGV
jgi:hypothetical protein